MDDSPVVVRVIRTPAQPPAPVRGERFREIASWLIGEGRFLADNAALFTAFCERAVGLGIPLDRASLHLRAMHPQYRGVSRIWRPGQPLDERFLDHGIEKTRTYLDSPVRGVVEDGESHAWRLDGNETLPFPMLEELRTEGYTHYATAPLIY